MYRSLRFINNIYGFPVGGLPSTLTFDGFLKSAQGNLNLITQALAAVGCEMQVIPDPTTVHFHLPTNISIRVHREYSKFTAELTDKFPHEKEGILKFYRECWKVCHNFYLSFSIEMTTTSTGCFGLYSLLTLACTFWIDFQCFELIGIEVT